MIKSLTPEWEFLAACLRSTLSPASEQPRAAPAGLDWERLLADAARHRCIALLQSALHRAGGAAIPAAARDRLRQAAATELRRSAFLLHRALDLLNVLRHAGIRAMPLKGPALSLMAYGDAVLRSCDDLDLLVPPAQFLAAQDVMRRQGFQPLVDLTPAEDRAHLRLGWDRGWRSPAGDYCVELAVSVCPAYFAFDLPAARLWANPGRLTMEGQEVEVPAIEHLLLLVSVHGAKHLWSRLIWAADIAGLLERACRDVDWEKLLRQASALGGKRLLLVGLDLARRLTTTALPPAVGAAMGEDPIVRVLAAQVQRQWQRPPPRVPTPWQEVRFHLRYRERCRDRLRYLARFALLPGYSDWRWIRLPTHLAFLYYVLRPFRLAFGRLRSGAPGAARVRKE